MPPAARAPTMRSPAPPARTRWSAAAAATRSPAGPAATSILRRQRGGGHEPRRQGDLRRESVQLPGHVRSVRGARRRRLRRHGGGRRRRHRHARRRRAAAVRRRRRSTSNDKVFLFDSSNNADRDVRRPEDRRTDFANADAGTTLHHPVSPPATYRYRRRPGGDQQEHHDRRGGARRRARLMADFDTGSSATGGNVPRHDRRSNDREDADTVTDLTIDGERSPDLAGDPQLQGNAARSTRVRFEDIAFQPNQASGGSPYAGTGGRAAREGAGRHHRQLGQFADIGPRQCALLRRRPAPSPAASSPARARSMALDYAVEAGAGASDHRSPATR